MIIKDIIKNSKKLRALTSLLPDEFKALLGKFEAQFEAYITRHNFDGSIHYTKYSQRSEKILVTSAEKLFFILVYHKQHPTQEFLAFSFGLNQDMCAKWIKVLLPILEKPYMNIKLNKT